MRRGFWDPIRVVSFAGDHVSMTSEEWRLLRAAILRWMTNGCAVVQRDGEPLDIGTVLASGATAMVGATLVIFHPHLAERFPSPAGWCPE